MILWPVRPTGHTAALQTYDVQVGVVTAPWRSRGTGCKSTRGVRSKWLPVSKSLPTPAHTSQGTYTHVDIHTHIYMDTGSPWGHILLGASVTASRALQTPPWPGGSSCSPMCLCRREGIGLGLPSQQGLILRQGIALYRFRGISW